jgi:LysM repeat protein
MIGLLLITTSCLPEDLVAAPAQAIAPSPTPQPAAQEISSTPLPTRPAYQPGELVDYVAQPGDTLPALAVHFNTTVREIRNANTFIPGDATTMPPGMPMKIPIYYQALCSFMLSSPTVLSMDRRKPVSIRLLCEPASRLVQNYTPSQTATAAEQRSWICR